MSLDVMFTDDPARVIDRAGAFLMAEPCLHNVILTLLHTRNVHRVPGRYWVASTVSESIRLSVAGKCSGDWNTTPAVRPAREATQYQPGTG